MKIPVEKDLTVEGMKMDSKEEQPANAEVPILVTSELIVTFFRLIHL